MASYYFQEDSSEDSSSPLEDKPVMRQRDDKNGAEHNSVASTAKQSPKSSRSSPGIPPAPSSGTSSASNGSPKRPLVLSQEASQSTTPKEDAKSLAIVIRNQQHLCRADLEESLFRNLFNPVTSLESENIGVLHASTDKHLPWTDKGEEASAVPMRLVPQTRVFYINKQYRTVLLVDVSSSVLTVDSGGSKIVMGQVMETLSRCLSGLAQRFSCPGMEDNWVQSDIHITVIAECSQFASNLHTGEMLANFPTMKVLMQDTILTEDNVHSVLKVLKAQLARFQKKLSRFRGDLRRTREQLGYSLAVEDAVDDENAEIDFEDDISNRKSWGVGLSGANLSYTLTAGLFALGLMPDSASPSLVIVTDGVVKSNLLHGSTILRRLMELDVSCSIIQLGNRDGAIPSCNWGFIQDSEALRFVSEATLGKFMYSQECLSPDSISLGQLLQHSERVAPNMYHRAFLVRELCLLKPRPGLEDMDEREDTISYSMANFPWDPKSQPEPIKMMQTACKDYLINIPVEKLVSARIRQGFRIKGVSVAQDRDKPSSERYMISMTLAWLPNVTVQYKLKGQASTSNGGNFFSRLESPKIEIDIIAYQAFAIHFLNSQHAPANANHSVYAKVFRLHRYIVGLSDSDVTLRGLNSAHSTANQAIWNQKAKSMERSRRPTVPTVSASNQEQEDRSAYMTRLSEQWSAFAKDMDYQYSRCWYSEYEFDALLIVPPPLFLPTAMDGEHTLTKYSENLEATVAQIRAHLKETWASFIVGDVFVQTAQAPEAHQSSAASTRFCELRLFCESSVSILKFQLRFFGMSAEQRRSTAQHLRAKIFAFESQVLEQSPGSNPKETPRAKVLQCQRPIHRLLMRHLIHEAPLSHTPETTLVDFHTHVSEPIGEESVLRSYMQHKHWGWKDQVRDSVYLAENHLMASQDMVFQFLCAQRTCEGFMLASVLPNRVVFYKEVDMKPGGSPPSQSSCATQYLIFRSPVSGELVTELWMEPYQDSERRSAFEQIKAEIIAVDRLVLSRLATYEAIHTIGRQRIRPTLGLHPERGFMYPWLFDPPTLLRQQRFITLAYEAPRRFFSPSRDVPEAPLESPKRCLHTLTLGTTSLTDVSSNSNNNAHAASSVSRDLMLTRNANGSATSLSQSLLEAETGLPSENELVTEYRDQIRELCCADRDLAILHLFMERSLSQLADGEIMPGNEDDSCSQFFMDIKTSIRGSPQIQQSLMMFNCTDSFQDIRCFVKAPNNKCFLLIIIPKLGSVISHISRLRSHISRGGDSRRETIGHDFLSCFMFDCIRSKPLETAAEFTAEHVDDQPVLFDIQPVAMSQIRSSVSQQPFAIQPIMFEAMTNQAKKQVKLRDTTIQLSGAISMAYSHSFTKAIYTSLIEGHHIDSEDLNRARQFCTKTSVDINITGLLNTLEQGRRNKMLRDDSSAIKARFLSVLRQSFELTPVPGSDQIYFYRPPLRKTSPKQAKPKTRKRSPSVSRSGSIDAELDDVLGEVLESAERPLFLHLECSFQKPLSQPTDLESAGLRPSVTFPVAGLPVSYIYRENGSRDQDYSPAKIGFDSRPVDSADGTLAMLHLVVSTLPPMDDGSTPKLKTIDSEAKIRVDSSQLTSARSLIHVFPTLDMMQLEAIADTQARLDWLLKEEVMHGLLNMALVTLDILNLVETQLKIRNDFVNFPTSMTIPLTFVKKRRGHDIFMQELGRANMEPFHLHQVGEYFYLTEADHPVTLEHDEGKDSSTTTNPQAVPQVTAPTKALESSVQPSNDLCHGLGIVILPQQTADEHSRTSEKLQPPEALEKSKRNFWLILIPKESYVQMYFFSKSLGEQECNTIVSRVRKSINDLCVKVNQLTLLQSLNESRMCSKYLVPSDENDPHAESGSGSSTDSDQASQEDEALQTDQSRKDGGSCGSKKFKPGEFACPLVYRIAWPLHWRVKPGLATKSVAHLVLYPFAVHNRKNFFVVESQDDLDESKKIVVFLRLSEIEVHPNQDIAGTSDDPKGPHLSVAKGEESSILVPIQAEDAGSHANSPRPSPSASPGSRNALPPAARTETRELVIEVFGVEPPGKQVTVDLFSLLESRFYNSVVLSVVSTFLSRNSTLKLTQADVDFILPVDRLEPARQVLRIPSFINVPYAFLMYLKQNLSIFLHPLTGADKVTALNRHYQSQFGRMPAQLDRSYDRGHHSHQLQVGDFSFFYNAVQGRPPSAVESVVGVGVAGVCLTVLGPDMRPTFDVGYQEGEHDMEDLKSYFDNFPKELEKNSSKYSLMVEVWAQGSVNATALLDAITQSFRQSLCDDIIETSIAQGLCPSARDRTNDVDMLDGEPLIGERVQRNFIDPSFMILKYSHEWKNPAVQSLSLEYSMPPWIMDSFLLELDEILTSTSVHFSPLLIRSMADAPRYKEYKASSGTKKPFDDMTNIRFILIGGIQDLSDGSSSSYYGRRTSMGSDRTHSRRSSLAESSSLQHSHKTSTHSSQQHPKKTLEELKMYPNAVTSSGQDETMLTRNCFVVMTANGFGLNVFTYNWEKGLNDNFFASIMAVVQWHKDRMRLLDNVLLQKMGLFHHVPSILSSAAPAPTVTPNPPAPTSASGPIQNFQRSGPQNSPHLGSNLRMGHSDSNSSTPNLAKTSTSPKTPTVTTVFPDANSLASLVDDQFPTRKRFQGSGASIYSTDDHRSDVPRTSSSALSLVSRPSPPTTASAQIPPQSSGSATSSDQNSPTLSNIITAGLDVDQILRDFCLDPLETPRDEDQIQDEVQRHGRPFLETFSYHTKNAEDQQNAYNVYQKWSRRYRDRKGAPNALHENMNISDLAIMLRSSRLLHFCRTPLLFTEFSSSLFPLANPTGTHADSHWDPPQQMGSQPKPGPSASDPVVQWYSALAETFMREYSQYLATVGMQLLMYGNSKFDKPVEAAHAGDLSFMSQFTVSQDLSVPSPAAFLFKSLQGGSIMCEVRLKGMFVCVTLYTLNRRYGRVKVAAPGFATAEANKQSLRAFTEQCARFKDRIHVNSFVYDFHLRYIHRILMESSKIGTASPSALPFSFDLMDVLHQFLQYHSRPAAYARNRVYRGVYRTNVLPGEGELPGHLFEYVIKNPQRYGFQAIYLQNRPRACFVSGHDLLAGFGGNSSGNGKHEGRKMSDGGQGLKGFGVSAARGGLALHTEQRPHLPHSRHTSHDSNLHTKRSSRRLTTSRSSYTVKDTAVLEEKGVEYVLVLSEGDQDSAGLTVHYYLLILREEEVVKKLEDAHGPLVGAKDRLLAANHNMAILRESSSGDSFAPVREVTDLSSFSPTHKRASQGILAAASFQVQARLGQSPMELEQERETPQEIQDDFTRGERLMDATELQEKITERAVLGDVVRAAEVRLDMMLRQAAQFFDRDSLWEMLLQGKIGNSGVILTGSNSSLASTQTNAQHHPTTSGNGHASAGHPEWGHPSKADNVSSSSAELGFADFLALGQRFHSTPLEEMEPKFKAMVTAPGMDWGEVLTFLGRYYARWAREFMEHDETSSPGPAVSSLRPGYPTDMGAGHRRGSVGRQGKARNARARRHLVIFNPHNRDLLVHFVINMNGSSTAHSRVSSSQQHGHPASDSTHLGESGPASRQYSQSHSQLQTLLLSPSSTRQPLPRYPVRPSLSESSSRVSSMSSIARAATMAVVSKMTGRIQSKRRDSVHSESDSQAASVMTANETEEEVAPVAKTTATLEPREDSRRSSTRRSWLGRSPRGSSGSRVAVEGRFEDGESFSQGSEEGDSDSDRCRRREMGGDSRTDEGSDEGQGREEGDDLEEEEEDSEGDEDDDEGVDEVDEDDVDEDGKSAPIRVFSVSREPKSGYNPIESEHVGDIIRTLSYWIWKAQN